ncbi:conserved hypothetical protein [Trichinella spiralis]|uniref:hypothetical protein n=1 Tax=Trichinella spiralis TaxID=6334 RepID=UPI0001EFBEDA|nr:conserved hypothetical protein [Trichinella spiralis]
MPASEKLLQTVVSENGLLDEWTIRRLDETERLIYLNKSSKTASWIPPPHLWRCSLGMPYGYEIAVGEYGENYYIKSDPQHFVNQEMEKKMIILKICIIQFCDQ